MNIIGQRLKELREGIGKSQAFIAKEIGTIAQPAIFRYENGQSDVPNAILLWYADYFDVSLDYIFGRTDKPQGKLYDYNPKAFDDEKMQQFVEMCFDPKSPANAKLKEMLLTLVKQNER
ncbi:MAG TPA: helix-turn-helix transcriptional regulator [Candidatus Caccosoma faecigallinarum]|uniref:Helix-turn-helix transcriptional regulator n=1 Tax=Candidatus Caccosoma faecigallinarum TaxID=2840720 RepID=A0A9D1G7C1_9FIRM|nr:helix-turn-helix transcriptional regulator [Candidatus Caccosoma faecigallinarum]